MDNMIGPVQRGTGKTTQEILNAPVNSFYVCLHAQHMRYVRELVKHLNRNDLWPVCPDYILRGMYRGSTWPIIIDHAILEHDEHAEELIMHAYEQARFIGPCTTSCLT